MLGLVRDQQDADSVYPLPVIPTPAASSSPVRGRGGRSSMCVREKGSGSKIGPNGEFFIAPPNGGTRR